MFIARYGLNPYITQIRFVFKGLKFADLDIRIFASIQSATHCCEKSGLSDHFCIWKNEVDWCIFLLCDSLAYEFYALTFRNSLFPLHRLC